MADIDDLKETFEQVVSAICRRDASAYSARNVASSAALELSGATRR